MSLQRIGRWFPVGVLLAAGLPAAGQQEQAPPAAPPSADVDWVQSPATVDLGSEAQIKLDTGYAFANAADTRKLMQSMGNTVDNTEVGLVVPKAEEEDWMLVFEYHGEGYVKDDDKDKIDADALLQSMKEGTEEANKRRKEMGIPALHVVGWDEKPNYDPVTHNLQWAVRGRNEDGSEVVNYNMRLLGRGGYMSVTLIDDAAQFAVSKPRMKAVLEGFGYKPGRTYAEFRQGDKVAQYGLAALVVGGAGAAAAKLGLFGVLAKFIGKLGKAAVLLVLALVAGLKKVWDAITGRSKERMVQQ